VKLWNQLRKDILESMAPALIYEESDIVKRSIRDSYTQDIEQILVQGEETYKKSKEFMKLLMPSHAPKVKKYKGESPIFSEHRVEEQIDKMNDPTAKMPGGGYIVINPTEALISIDVNSGRATGGRSIEETALKTNLEAAKVIAKQLRLRDLAGLIVIDFIDMLYARNRKQVERAFKDALKADRAKLQVGRISAFGLVEMSRQRMRSSFAEINMTKCPHCNGNGVVRSDAAFAIQLIREIEAVASAGNFESLQVTCRPEVVLYLLNHKREDIAALEVRHGLRIIFSADHELLTGRFKIDKTKKLRGSNASREDEGDAEEGRKSSRRGGRGRGRRRDKQEEEVITEESDADTSEAEEMPVSEDAEEAPKEEAAEKKEKPRRTMKGVRRRTTKKAEAETVEEAPAKEEKEEARKAKPKAKRATKKAKEEKVEEAKAPDNVIPMEPKEPEATKAEPEVAELEYNGPKRKGWWNKLVE
jgi:ribonuclease E